MTNFLRIISVISLLFLYGCKTVDVRGQYVSDEYINEINKEKPTKEKLADMIGSPTYVPDYSPNTWYYIQRSLAKRAWFTPTVQEQRIVKVTFANEKVISAELLNNTQNEYLQAQSAFTKTKGTDQSGIQKFVKNIGRFNKTTDGKGRKKKRK
ncbi:MAG: outer membrane protein assembly factor BamE [Rickettsiales bacterium]|nr:outer membrane protein assembly factor BamE [Rickettsiales bacterium]